MNKKLTALYIIISFIGIAVFGFSGLISHDSLFSKCVSAVVPGGMPCTGNTHNEAMDVLHAKIFLSFSIALMVAAVIFVALGSYFLFYMKLQFSSFRFMAIEAVNSNSLSASVRKYADWLELVQQHPARIF